MTNSQAEAAARKLCELRGVDPDATVSHGVDVPDYAPDGYAVPYVLLYSPAWRRALRDVRAAEAMQVALEHGRAQP